MIKYEELLVDVDDEVKNSILTLQDIEIDERNNMGCNGYVFFGNHQVFRKRIALKYYYYGENAHEEVSLIKQISNPNIQKIWDAHTVGGGWAYFITDQQVDGSLEQILSERKLSTKEAIHITRGIIGGISSLHAKPNYLIHRDIKPANILINKSGDAIIADFGSIKRMPENCTSVVTSAGHTPLYKPPEAFAESVYGYSSDIYQIGIVLYQLLGGELSINAIEYMTKKEILAYEKIDNSFDKSLFEDKCLFEKISRGKLLKFNSLPKYTDGKIIKLIKKATKADKADRYQTAADLRAALYKMGNLPNWYEKNEMLMCETNTVTYRIRQDKGNKCIIEKLSKQMQWSKLRGSARFNNEDEAVYYLKTII